MTNDKIFGKTCPLPKIPMYKSVQKDWEFLDSYFQLNLPDESGFDSIKIFIPLKSKNRVFNGLFLVLKKGLILSEENLQFKEEMNEYGVKVDFCWNFDEIKTAIMSYLEL